jgi:hypothetical protein
MTQLTQLRRAHARAQVIQANLEYLGDCLSEAAPALQRDLKAFEQTFKLYVSRLGDACDDGGAKAAAA